MLNLKKLVGWIAVASCLVAATSASSPTDDPDSVDGLTFSHEFTRHRFGMIPAGEQIPLSVHIENKGEVNYTVINVSGALVDPTNSARVLRNLTSLHYKTFVPVNSNATIPFKFEIEADPMDVGLIVYVKLQDKAGKVTQAVAHRGKISIVENDSMFDLQSISIYLMGLALSGAVAYSAYLTYYVGNKPTRTRRPRPVVVERTDITPGEPDMDWIPEHLIQQQQGGKRQSVRIKKRKDGANAKSSGEE
ncbi:translocon-associated protein [Phlyctochytrium arcticum]|nr:translocon-associated protein [Phlyctochytrium arcticum]